MIKKQVTQSKETGLNLFTENKKGSQMERGVRKREGGRQRGGGAEGANIVPLPQLQVT